MKEIENKKTNRIVFLDYLRIFAFLSVLAGHKFYDHAVNFIENEEAHATPRFLVELLLPLLEGGGAGVVVFFLISGYIITYVLQNEQTTEFYIKRIFRIYPLYIVAVLLYTGKHALSSGELPDPWVVIQQLLLIGDLFETPLALGGVEWTLRVEILFYCYMGIVRYLGFLHTRKLYLPILIVGTSLFLLMLAPIPSHETWTKGYVTIYGPFLLLGSFFYLKEKNQIGGLLFAGLAALVLVQYYYLISVHQARWVNAHFATLSVVIFYFSWRYRSRFIVTPLVLLLSDLTYSVYLFHNWSWPAIKTTFSALSISILHPDVQALFGLFALCYLMLIFIEKPGIKLGKLVLKHVK
jgi:peptidoglycan/LPS O-acetylase OafA/YrhL